MSSKNTNKNKPVSPIPDQRNIWEGAMLNHNEAKEGRRKKDAMYYISEMIRRNAFVGGCSGNFLAGDHEITHFQMSLRVEGRRNTKQNRFPGNYFRWEKEFVSSSAHVVYVVKLTFIKIFLRLSFLSALSPFVYYRIT